MNKKSKCLIQCFSADPHFSLWLKKPNCLFCNWVIQKEVQKKSGCHSECLLLMAF